MRKKLQQKNPTVLLEWHTGPTAVCPLLWTGKSLLPCSIFSGNTITYTLAVREYFVTHRKIIICILTCRTKWMIRAKNFYVSLLFGWPFPFPATCRSRMKESTLALQWMKFRDGSHNGFKKQISKRNTGFIEFARCKMIPESFVF